MKRKYFSPGRINLIGEHVDNFGGHVFPAAINLGIEAIVEKRPDKSFQFRSNNGETVLIHKLVKQTNQDWVNYCIGMFLELNPNPRFGLNISLNSNLPMGAGLSSSAALEVLIGTIINREYDLGIDPLSIVKTAKKVENEFIGVACGIMDQFACGMGQEKKAMFLDTASLEVEQVPIELDGYVLVVANSNKKRALVDSAYNERKEDADRALIKIQTILGVVNLASLTLEEFNTLPNGLLTENEKKRVKHIVTEEQRTIQAKRELSNHNIDRFGELLNETHKSLRDEFEVSCLELDTLQELFVETGAIGARMVGAGFGGCVLALLKEDTVDELIEVVWRKYMVKIGYAPDMYKVNVEAGAHFVEEIE